MQTGIIENIYPSINTELSIGTKLIDFEVELSLGVAHDCPPISFHRIALRERAWFRQTFVQIGDHVAPKAIIAIFSSSPDEHIDTIQVRALRVSIFGILPQNEFP
jgi:hypothetical protein